MRSRGPLLSRSFAWEKIRHVVFTEMSLQRGQHQNLHKKCPDGPFFARFSPMRSRGPLLSRSFAWEKIRHVVFTEMSLQRGQHQKNHKQCPDGPFFARFSPMRSRGHMLLSSFAFSSLQVYFWVQKKVFWKVFFQRFELKYLTQFNSWRISKVILR